MEETWNNTASAQSFPQTPKFSVEFFSRRDHSIPRSVDGFSARNNLNRLSEVQF